jgi:hypothetical protein
MALPLSRNTTYGVGAIILSADLNALQDSIVGKKHGAVTKQIHGAKFTHVSTATTAIGRDIDGGVVAIAGAALFLPITEIDVGCVITAVRLRMRDSTPEVRKFQLQRYTEVTPALSILATSGNSTGTGVYQTISVGSLAVVVTAAQPLGITFLINSGSTVGAKVHSVEIDYYHP